MQVREMEAGLHEPVLYQMTRRRGMRQATAISLKRRKPCKWRNKNENKIERPGASAPQGAVDASVRNLVTLLAVSCLFQVS